VSVPRRASALGAPHRVPRGGDDGTVVRQSVETRTGAAAELHASWPSVTEDPGLARLAVCSVVRPAVVLGSTQDVSVVDLGRAARLGVDVVRRRSGGGAVLVTPDDPVWVDAWVPHGDPRWDDDVARAFDWFGDLWAEALAAVGCAPVTVQRGPYRARSPWGSLVCFGGVGRGEVVAADGRKVVGISQRRNRLGAWFHGAANLTWDAAPLLDVLRLSAADRAAARVELEGLVVGVGDLVSGAPGRDRLRSLVVGAVTTLGLR